jgi:5'-deoxynucleotidase YfbR-like HD superfamily hydrolase
VRRGDWIQTYTGKKFWPMDPHVDDVDIEDVAHALSMQCRYAGHCVDFYSVAEHSVLLSHYALHALDDSRLALWLLLHDGSEAYLQDVVRPVKQHLTGYKSAETVVQDVVYCRYGLRLDDQPALVDVLDRRILLDEREQVMRQTDAVWDCTEGLEPLGMGIPCWTPHQAESRFIAQFAALTS